LSSGARLGDGVPRKRGGYADLTREIEKALRNEPGGRRCAAAGSTGRAPGRAL
jgi:hypothetical protein